MLFMGNKVITFNIQCVCSCRMVGTTPKILFTLSRTGTADNKWNNENTIHVISGTMEKRLAGRQVFYFFISDIG